jgi:hypothetical protein
MWWTIIGSNSGLFGHGSECCFQKKIYIFVRFEVFTAITMKNTVFWDVAPCRYFVNRRFGGTYRLHLQGRRNPRVMNQREQLAVDWVTVRYTLLTLVHRSWISSTLETEAIRSSETSVNKIPTRRHIPKDGILQQIFLFSANILCHGVNERVVSDRMILCVHVWVSEWMRITNSVMT